MCECVWGEGGLTGFEAVEICDESGLKILDGPFALEEPSTNTAPLIGLLLLKGPEPAPAPVLLRTEDGKESEPTAEKDIAFPAPDP